MTLFIPHTIFGCAYLKNNVCATFLSPVGTVIFANCPFPTLDEDASETRPITIGEGFCRKPYKLAKITVPTGLRFLVDPNATVVSVLLAALCTQSRSARLNGISSLSIAKKYKLWGVMLLVVVIYGQGKVSLDHIICKKCH
jgi:hypothetical protein